MQKSPLGRHVHYDQLPECGTQSSRLLDTIKVFLDPFVCGGGRVGNSHEDSAGGEAVDLKSNLIPSLHEDLSDELSSPTKKGYDSRSQHVAGPFDRSPGRQS